MKYFQFFMIAALLLCLNNATSYAQFSEAEPAPPPGLKELQTVRKDNITSSESLMPLNIRKGAIEEAALSYGARGGLAWRTYEIRKELEKQASYLDKVYDFRYLLIAAPSGLLIEPPIVTESINAMIIDAGGQEAAVADRIYDINRNARIVSTARSWRNYLERKWGDIQLPPDVLRPSNPDERRLWKSFVRKGWIKGLEQADEIFQQDLNELTSHYEGMVRYRKLLLQGMISPPYTMQTDRGITGGGNTMRIGDRAVQITGSSQLMTGAKTWQPASQ